MVGQTSTTKHVQYWAVGSTSMISLPMSENDISKHLLADWVPSIPAAVSSSFMGWPSLLIETYHHPSVDFLSLREEVGKSERQWKGFLSWMLGIAGTRHVLGQEGYRWIAPASAFYPGVTHPVDVNAWHPSFPPNDLTVTLPPNPKVRLRPDYLAIRLTPGGKIEWAVAEAKGTARCLTNMTKCPSNWRNQAHNIEVSVNGNSLNIPRYIVVATRSNPNAKYTSTRQLQIRGWNSMEEASETKLLQKAAVNIASAHLFGLFRNLGLRENAMALAYSVEARDKPGMASSPIIIKEALHRFNDKTESLESTSDFTICPDDKLKKVFRESEIEDSIDSASKFTMNAINIPDTVKQLREKADSELEERGSKKSSTDKRTQANIEISSELGRISIEISPETLTLATKLSTALTQEDAMKALKESSTQLDEWEKSQSNNTETESVLSAGVRIQFPKRIPR